MKRVPVVSALIGAIFALTTSIASAQPSVSVRGAGSTTVAGQVVVQATATGPATGFFPVYPASGFVSARNLTPFFGASGNLSARVTCIGQLPGHPEVAVSGPGFTALVWPTSKTARGGVQVWSAGPFEDCGTNLFFAAGQELPETVAATTLVQGHFAVSGTST